jgi:hypothetical protein
MSSKSSLACTATMLLLIAPSTFGRRVENWPYERLFNEAELVILARATSSADSGEKVKHKDWSTEFLGVNTSSEVLHVLKGKAAGKQLSVFHLCCPTGVKIENGPGFVSFRLKGLAIEGAHGKMETSKPTYMLFLKKSKDGRWEAVSGQIDPDQSVWELHSARFSEGLDRIHNKD